MPELVVGTYSGVPTEQLRDILKGAIKNEDTAKQAIDQLSKKYMRSILDPRPGDRPAHKQLKDVEYAGKQLRTSKKHQKEVRKELKQRGEHSLANDPR